MKPAIAEIIARDVRNWDPKQYICWEDLARYRTEYVTSLLAAEKGELGQLEHEVLGSMQQHEVLATDVDRESEQKRSAGERLADRIAAIGGSWRFLIVFALLLAGWVMLNSKLLAASAFDPYPFILLNLLLSTLAAVQAPVILMSQNRQAAKDRVRAQHDYQVNLKAELEIRHLHEKMDHLLSHQWERLVEIQQVQLELLTELGHRR